MEKVARKMDSSLSARQTIILIRFCGFLFCGGFFFLFEALSLKSFDCTESLLFVKNEKEESHPHYTVVELKNKDQPVSVTLPSVHR